LNLPESPARRLAHRFFVNDHAFERAIEWCLSRLRKRHVAQHGDTVLHGPFAGMRLDPAVSVHSKLLGTYEVSLHAAGREAADPPPGLILDVGRAEGYHAAGFALLCPAAEVRAYDIDLV
jgi:hypothetical protein